MIGRRAILRGVIAAAAVPFMGEAVAKEPSGMCDLKEGWMLYWSDLEAGSGNHYIGRPIACTRVSGVEIPTAFRMREPTEIEDPDMWVRVPEGLRKGSQEAIIRIYKHSPEFEKVEYEARAWRWAPRDDLDDGIWIERELTAEEKELASDSDKGKD